MLTKKLKIRIFAKLPYWMNSMQNEAPRLCLFAGPIIVDLFAIAMQRSSEGNNCPMRHVLAWSSQGMSTVLFHLSVWIVATMGVDGADPFKDLRARELCTLNSLSFSVVVSNCSYVKCSFVFNGFTRKKKRQSQLRVALVVVLNRPTNNLRKFRNRILHGSA